MNIIRSPFLVFTLLLASEIFAQQAYREDQVYVDFNFILQNTDDNRFSDNGFSRSLHVGILRDVFLTSSGRYSLGIGVGYGLTRLVNNIEIETQADDFSISYPRPDRSYRNFFTFHELQLPIEFRWRTSSESVHQFWRIHAGYRLGYPFATKYKPFFGADYPTQGVLSSWQHEINLAVGYNTWNLRFAYQLNPLINSSLRKVGDQSFRLHFFQIGLIFYLL